MLNADMIEDVQFLTGGYPVQYGNRSSSVMNITVREGNRDVGFSSNSGFNMAGYGTLMEGGFAGGKGSFIISARQSLLQLVDKLVGLRVTEDEERIGLDLTQHRESAYTSLG